jgi:toxin YoeB
MIIKWAENAWDDYIYWQTIDKKITQKINLLIKDIQRHPFEGIGNPEPLKHNWSGFWSRRINKEHRLIYAIEKEELLIAQCRFHY